MIENLINIGKLAKATGTPAETIRYYEKIGLLSPPVRTESNYRLYRADDVDRLSFVRRARDIGFSIEQVRSLLALADHREEDCAMVDRLALENLATIERKIADLMILKQQLAGLLSSCKGGTVGDCRIIDALSPGASSTCLKHSAEQPAEGTVRQPRNGLAQYEMTQAPFAMRGVPYSRDLVDEPNYPRVLSALK